MPQLLPSVGRWSVLVAAAALVAACSESSTTPSRSLSPTVSNADNSPWPEFNSPSSNAHIMHTKPWFAANGNGGAGNGRGGGGGGGGTGISYHGGPLLVPTTNVVAIYWSASTIFNNGPAADGNAGSAGQDGSLVGYFLSHLTGSSYFNINTTYYDGTGAHVQNVVNYNGYWANKNAPPSAPSDADMVAMLQSGFNTGKLTYNSSTLYAIFTGSGVNLGGGFGSQYCAYHTHGTVSIGGVNKTVLYAAMPYNIDFPGGCTNGTAAPNGDPAADAEVNTLAHETEETTTDLMGNAWFDFRGMENADKCAWNFGTLQNNGKGIWNIQVGAKQFLVQQNWINSGSGGCRLSF